MESCSMSSGFIQVAETADLISMVLFMNNEKGYIVQWVEVDLVSNHLRIKKRESY